MCCDWTVENHDVPEPDKTKQKKTQNYYSMMTIQVVRNDSNDFSSNNVDQLILSNR